MLATPTRPRAFPGRVGWLHEIKWDGVRALAETADGALRLFNRSGGDISAAYPDIVAGATGLPDGLLLDGEIIAIDPALGVPTLQAIAPRIHVRDPERASRLSTERPATFMAFDVLRFDGRDIARQPLEARRHVLEQLDLPRRSWQVSETYDDAETISRIAHESGLEGVMSKRLGSPYEPGPAASTGSRPRTAPRWSR
ncbi:hypothetical protein G7085_14150 [Tessaracoccus sp. HDW20]|uniref:ATP-dependent DNA ligase n=1 Tax=Tessaracoccus coleopterorum TaxID=2714950 RepID=UPI0018D3634A|nr:hypothetical protein [Tessaracoccus coleopterorum]NHB85378.1 hypothetical protein [Tessaracoccus coleopterorum]